MFIHDRGFWIYIIITLFFIIIGASLILRSKVPNSSFISILWSIANIFLMTLVYNVSTCCTIEENVCKNRTFWLVINSLFIILLLISTIWAGELSNRENNKVLKTTGVMMILGGIVVYKVTSDKIGFINHCNLSSWVFVGYLFIWFGLLMYDL